MFGFDWLTTDLLGAGVGAIAGGSSGGGEQTQKTTLDPRIAQYVYGTDGNSGLLGDAQSIYQQQMNQGGLNDMQRQGMGMQYQYLTSPQYQQGAQQKFDVGSGLLGGGVAGNPFTRSQGMQGAAPQRAGFQFAPSSQAPIQSYAPQRPQATAPAAGLLGNVQSGGSGGGGFAIGGGQTSKAAGQGVNNDTAAAALQAMALSENPAIRALSPSIAALLGLGGSVVAGQQADAMGAAGAALSNVPAGMGAMSDASGNVLTYSSPATIAAQDAAMFGPFGGFGSGGHGSGGHSFGGYGGGIGQSGGNAAGMGSHQA